MAFFDHIRLCNRHDPGRYVPFSAGGLAVGRVRHDVAGWLGGLTHLFERQDGAVLLRDVFDTPEARSDALDEAADLLARHHGTPAPRGERYRVVAGRFTDPPLMTVDRGVVSLFGLPAYGVHMNGMVRGRNGHCLWIGRRAADKSVAPGKLDNMVAGGQPAGLTLMENLIKEAGEEAAIPPALAATARPVGAISYCMEDTWGLKPDTMFCFDLEVPEDFEPRNTDGEIAEFLLMPVEAVAQRVRDTEDFKFNVNLVITHFLMRHGYLSPDVEPDYQQLAQGLCQSGVIGNSTGKLGL